MTQRKRAIGFALMDTAFAADAKFVRLARKATDEVAFAASVGVFWLILADARRARSAVVNWDDYTEYADQIAALKDAKLLTVNGFDSETFDRWAPAYKVPERTPRYPRVPDGTRKPPPSEHGAYPSVPNGTPGTIEDHSLISDQINSDLTNGVGGPGEGEASEPGLFMRSPPGPRIIAATHAVRDQHEDAFQLCGKCGERKGGPAHGSKRDHEFEAVA